MYAYRKDIAILQVVEVVG